MNPSAIIVNQHPSLLDPPPFSSTFSAYNRKEKITLIAIASIAIISEVFLLWQNPLLGILVLGIAAYYDEAIADLFCNIVQHFYHPLSVITSNDRKEPIFQEITEITSQYLTPFKKFIIDCKKITQWDLPAAAQENLPYISYGKDDQGRLFFIMKTYYKLIDSRNDYTKTGFEGTIIYKNESKWRVYNLNDQDQRHRDFTFDDFIEKQTLQKTKTLDEKRGTISLLPLG